MEEGKAKALESVLVQIEKQYGKGAIMKLGQDAGCLLYTSDAADE